MSEITAQDQYNTKAHAFVARRGALVMKEFLPVGTLSGEYRVKLEVETLIFSSMQAGKIDRTYGLKITVTTRDDGYERDGSCLIDQDELNELVSGLQYLDEKTQSNVGECSSLHRDGLRN